MKNKNELWGITFLAALSAIIVSSFWTSQCGPASCHNRETKQKLDSIEDKLGNLKKLDSLDKAIHQLDLKLIGIEVDVGTINRRVANLYFRPSASRPASRCKITESRKIPDHNVDGAPDLVLKCTQLYNYCHRNTTIFCSAAYRDRTTKQDKVRVVDYTLRVKCGDRSAVARRMSVIWGGGNQALASSITSMDIGGVAGILSSKSVRGCPDINFEEAVWVKVHK